MINWAIWNSQQTEKGDLKKKTVIVKCCMKLHVLFNFSACKNNCVVIQTSLSVKGNYEDTCMYYI